jgi:hypothetical protein
MIYDQIFANLNEIIGNNKANENVYNTFIFAQEKIKNKEISIEINPNINNELNLKMANTILGGMYFRKDKFGSINLVFGNKYLDTYTKYSTIHHTILMHEFKHLNDYYQNKDNFFKSNEKETFQYELNSVNIEVEFIKYYLVGKFNLSKYENYILNRKKKDNLESLIILNKKQSVNIFRFLNNLEINYKNNEITEDQLIKELIQKTDQLLNKSDLFLNLIDVYNSSKDNFSRFGHFIRIKTFEKYLKYLFNDFNEMENIIFKNSDLEYNIISIINLIRKYDEANKMYSLALDNYFENEFEKL